MDEIDKHKAQQQLDKHMERITKLQELLDIEEKQLHELINSCGEKAWEDYINAILIESEQ